MKKGILFDLDGTLWDASAECVEAWNEAIRLEAGRTEQFTQDDMHGFMGKTIEAIAALMFPTLPEAERLAILKLCTDREHKYIETHRPKLYADEKAILERLSKEYTLGVVSNCQDGYIEIYLAQCGFPELFSDYECPGRTGKSKGENIRLVMERQGLTECVYVGDTDGDREAAERAGIPFIHAAYGFGKVLRCAARLEALSDLPSVVETIL